MQFNSLGFYLFFVLCITLYYCLAENKKKWIIGIFSIVFYEFFGIGAGIVLIAVALLSWCGEIIIEKRQKKEILLGFIVCVLAPLVVLKYLNIFPEYAVPIGISFFTLQAISGMVDVYRGKSGTSDFGTHLMYLAFFPTIVSGPIIRKKEFLSEINRTKKFVYEDVRRGIYRIAIGFIEKFFLADRIGKLVNYVYEYPNEVSGAQIVVATILFGLQLYYDFAGYSHMAIGFARCMGINIMENFERPYFAQSIKEFWRRWHISLSSWLRDYVYIPLGGSRKGTVRKYVNLIITFLVSGIWHGVGINFLFWGLLHGIYQVVEDKILEIEKQLKLHINYRSSKNVPLLRIIVVFILVDFAWLFFRASDMTIALQMVKKVLLDFRVTSLFTTWWFDYCMSKLEYLMWVIVAVAIFLFDIMEEKDKNFIVKFENQKIAIRWCAYIVVVSIIVVIVLINVGSNANSFLYQNF